MKTKNYLDVNRYVLHMLFDMICMISSEPTISLFIKCQWGFDVHTRQCSLCSRSGKAAVQARLLFSGLAVFGCACMDLVQKFHRVGVSKKPIDRWRICTSSSLSDFDDSALAALYLWFRQCSNIRFLDGYGPQWPGEVEGSEGSPGSALIGIKFCISVLVWFILCLYDGSKRQLENEHHVAWSASVILSGKLVKLSALLCLWR